MGTSRLARCCSLRCCSQMPRSARQSSCTCAVRLSSALSNGSSSAGTTGAFSSKDPRERPALSTQTDANVDFVQGRILVKVKTTPRMGNSIGRACLGISMATMAPTAEVSVAPYGEGETIGFRDAELLKVSDQRESFSLPSKATRCHRA